LRNGETFLRYEIKMIDFIKFYLYSGLF